MHCPRLDHFIRLNSNGTLSCCGHMVNAKRYNTAEELSSSKWIKELKDTFSKGQWPDECIRCKDTENLDNQSIRLNSISFNKDQTVPDYLIVAGVLDNICNSACITCNEKLSTKIGRLITKDYIRIDNLATFWQLPQDRIVRLEINGGEPSASLNYKQILQHLPKNVKSIRVNTNAINVLQELKDISTKVDVTVTISFDGTEQIHEYVRWPSKWSAFINNIKIYNEMGLKELNLWTTISTLNILNLEEIFKFATEQQINHSYALLETPNELNVRFKNTYTLKAREQLLNNKLMVLHNISKIVATGPSNDNELCQFINEQNTLRDLRSTPWENHST